LKCISISFKTAPEDIRNKFAFTNSEKKDFLSQLSEFITDAKCVILGTCNRTEIYVESHNGVFSILENLLSRKTKLSISEIRKYARYYEEESAIEHIFKVTCGLDSMILGENEILSQVKQTYLESLQEKRTGYELNITFLSALSCAKKIKTQTEIAKSAISFATLTCNEIKNFIQENNITSPSILIIGGSGKIGSSIIKNILNKDFNAKIYVTQRSHGNTVDFTDKVEVLDYIKRFEYLKNVDIVISATKSPHYTINYEDTLPNISSKKMLFIDLASPYDIDREISKIQNCTLITIDYFKEIVKNNNLKKEKAVADAQDILNQELQKIFKNIIYHNALEKIQAENEKFKDFSLEKFLYYLKDKLDAKSFANVINTIENNEGSLIH
jgi:glutamyl-tRNA reductase